MTIKRAIHASLLCSLLVLAGDAAAQTRETLARLGVPLDIGQAFLGGAVQGQALLDIRHVIFGQVGGQQMAALALSDFNRAPQRLVEIAELRLTIAALREQADQPGGRRPA